MRSYEEAIKKVIELQDFYVAASKATTNKDKKELLAHYIFALAKALEVLGIKDEIEVRQDI